ncbi:MAG TPA: hypothetical protein VM165_07620, partial [Planctomycetaceae bacterium]|nr:hypothetical protein [Planctomycetaceae bacterium]
MKVSRLHWSQRLAGGLSLWSCLAGLGSFQAGAATDKKDTSDELFTNSGVRHLAIQISKEGMETL